MANSTAATPPSSFILARLVIRPCSMPASFLSKVPIKRFAGPSPPTAWRVSGRRGRSSPQDRSPGLTCPLPNRGRGR